MVDLYAQVYSLLTSLRACRGRWRVEELLEGLVEDAMRWWVGVLCAASPHQLRQPPCWACEGLDSSTTRPSADGADVRSVAPVNEMRSRAPGLTAVPDVTTDTAWQETIVAVRDRWGALRARHIGASTAVPSDAALLVMTTLSHHYRVMMRLLCFAFMRVDGLPGATGLVPRVLRRVTHELLQHNHALVLDALAYAAETVLCVAFEVSGTGLNEEWWFRPPVSHETAAVDETSFCDAAPRTSVRRQTPLEVDCEALGEMHALLEDCGLAALQATNNALVQQHCVKLGRSVVCTTLGGLSTAACDDDDDACDRGVGGDFALAALGTLHYTVVDANRALREVMRHYIRLRSALLRYYAGTAQLIDRVPATAHGAVVQALQAFLAGLAEGAVLGDFVVRWSVPLWLQLCEETLRCQDEERGAGRREARDGCTPHAPSCWGAMTELERGVGNHGSARGTTRSAASTAHSVCDTADPTIAARRRLHYVTRLPADGFATLLYVLPTDETVRGTILGQFGDAVQRHLNALLRGQPAVVPGRRAGATAVLPPVVFERCIFALKMTYAAFRVEMERTTRVRDTPDDVESERESELESDDTQSASEDRDAVGTAWERSHGSSLRRRRRYLTSAEDALVAVRRGLRAFFAQHETLAIPTLACALHAQTLLPLPQSVAPSTLDVIDTLLDLATLLPSKDIFVTYYERLLASHLLTVTEQHGVSSGEVLRGVAEVVRRMSRRLGRGVTGRCQSLLRDVTHALRDESHFTAVLTRTRGPDDWSRTRMATSSSSMSYPAVLLQRAASLLRPTSAAAERTAWGWWQPSPRTSSAHHHVVPSRRALLTGVRVLCQVWWEPYSTVNVTSAALRAMRVDGGWWQDRLVDAVLRVEWTYAGRPMSEYESFGAGRGGNAHEPRRGRTTTTASSSRRVPSESVESDLRASLAALSQSTSQVMHSVSSALTSAMQQGGNRLYDNLRATNYHSSSLGNAEYDSAGEEETEGYTDLQAAAALTSLPMPDVPVRRRSREDATWAPHHARRRLVWPLCSGELTVVVHGTGGRRDAVQVTGPPLTLLVLQFLDRHASKPDVGCTLGYMQAHLPVRIPVRVLTTLVTTLARMGVVRRVAGEEGRAVYSLPESFAHLPQRKVLVRPRRPPHHWEELTAGTVQAETTPEAGDATGVTDVADLQRVFFAARSRKVQVSIVREMKTAETLTHAELFRRVGCALQDQFVLSVALFKQGVERLMERGFLERHDPDTYSYVF